MTDVHGIPSPHSPPAPGYEDSPVHTRGVFYFILYFVITMAVLLLLLWWLERGLLGGRHAETVAPPMQLPQPLQPSPQHPVLPWQDMVVLRGRQEERLNSAGPLPGDASHRHIPIGQAIDGLLRSGELQRPFSPSATQPFILPTPQKPQSVENRT